MAEAEEVEEVEEVICRTCAGFDLEKERIGPVEDRKYIILVAMMGHWKSVDPSAAGTTPIQRAKGG